MSLGSNINYKNTLWRRGKFSQSC